MVREFFIKLIMRAKEVAEALKAKFVSLADRFRFTVPAEKFPVPVLSPKTAHAMNMGKRYRPTSDHAPVFSLYTFFGDRQ
jgi:hypothetical protein